MSSWPHLPVVSALCNLEHYPTLGVLRPQAWNRRQVCLQYDSLGVLRFRVLSVDLWDKSPAELCEKVDKDGNLKPDKKG